MQQPWWVGRPARLASAFKVSNNDLQSRVHVAEAAKRPLRLALRCSWPDGHGVVEVVVQVVHWRARRPRHGGLGGQLNRLSSRGNDKTGRDRFRARTEFTMDEDSLGIFSDGVVGREPPDETDGRENLCLGWMPGRVRTYTSRSIRIRLSRAVVLPSPRRAAERRNDIL